MLLSLSSPEKSDALFDAATNWRSAEVIFLLSIETNATRVIQLLAVNYNESALRLIINASLEPIFLLVDQIEEKHTESVNMLSTINDLGFNTVSYLIDIDDLNNAKSLIEMMPDRGSGLVTTALAMSDLTLAKALIGLGADGEAALISLLNDKQFSFSYQLSKLGINLNHALRLATQQDNIALQDQLIWLTAKPYQTVLESFATKDPNTIRHTIDRLGDNALIDAVSALLGSNPNNTFTNRVKAEAISQLLPLKINLDGVLRQLLNDKNTQALRLLLRMGTSTQTLMIALATEGNRIDLKRLMLCGADFTQPMQVLQANRELKALTTLCIALVGTKDLKATVSRQATLQGSQTT